LKSALSSEWFRTFDELTELALSSSAPTLLLFSWSAPMLFLGMTAWTAATLVPARATRSAREATTIEGDGRSRRRCVITRDLLRAFGSYSFAVAPAVLMTPATRDGRGSAADPISGM
jgi:hypothetical protein